MQQIANMKISAIEATNYVSSINCNLLQYTAKLALEYRPRNIVKVIDFEIPLHTQIREGNNGIPNKAQYHYDKIIEADSVINSFAEHNDVFTNVYKNLFDWASRIEQKSTKRSPWLSWRQHQDHGAGVLNVVEMGTTYFRNRYKGQSIGLETLR
ncbi:MAG: NAD(P)H-dependent oxidoreductase [Verrucomicrobiota bacterium]